MIPRPSGSALLRHCRPTYRLSRTYASATPDAASPAPSYVPPLQPGVLPVYDVALQYIAEDQRLKRGKLKELVEKTGRNADKDVKETIEKLEVECEINDPEVRWRFQNRLWDMSKPVYRYLRNQEWRQRGVLDLLMERVHQMHVIPDLLPSLHPTVDFEVRFPNVADGNTVQPGIFLLPEQTTEPPELTANVFHGDERLYTVLMIDPDTPEPENQTFTTFLHWLVPNIPISPLTPTFSLPPALLPYIPPHPQAGTPYHRYSTFLLPQSGPIADDLAPPERRGFSLREFVRAHGLQGDGADGSAEVVGGGVHMWREVWDEKVGEIYLKCFGTPEPRYGRPKKVDPYLNEEGVRPAKYY